MLQYMNITLGFGKSYQILCKVKLNLLGNEHNLFILIEFYSSPITVKPP